MRIVKVGILLSLAAASATASSEEYADFDLAELYDEELVSIATGTAQPLRLVPSVASVITAEQIEASGALTLDEVLETVPGLHVSVSSNRMGSIYSVRGLHTSQNPQVLLLVDGVRITQSFTGGRPARFRLPVHSIDRIEVIRGPGSAVYGADAFAGVINVITKSAEEIGDFDGGMLGGSFGSREVWAQSSAKMGDWKASVSVEYSRADGDDSRELQYDIQSVLDAGVGGLVPGYVPVSNAPGPMSTAYEILTGNVKLGNDKFSAEFWGWKQDKAGLGAGALALDPDGYVDVDYYRLKTSYTDTFAENWEASLKLLYTYGEERSNYHLLPAGAIAPILADGNLDGRPIDPANPQIVRLAQFTDGVLGGPQGFEETFTAESVLFYRGFAGHLLRFSFGYQLNDLQMEERKNYGPGVLDSEDTFDGTLDTLEIVTGERTDVSNTPYAFSKEKDVQVKYLTLQDEWQLSNDWTLTAGVRYDDYSNFGDTVNPRLALVWAMDYDLTSKVLYGRAFRAPSNGELYSVNNPVLLGNENLDPEIMDTVELEVDYRPLSGVNSKFNVFVYKTEDLIEYVGAGENVAQAQNIGEQKGYGFEWEVNWKLNPQWNLLANYSLQKSSVNTTLNDGTQLDDVEAPDAPGQQVFVSAQWQGGDNLSAYLSNNWVLDRKDRYGDEVSDYSWANLTLKKRNALPGLDISLMVKNLFDVSATESVSGDALRRDYPLESRSGYIEFRYHH